MSGVEVREERRVRVVREVGVECFRSHTDNVWTNIGREICGIILTDL